MRRIDAWLGKYVFQPPVILLCQITGMTQYAVYRYLWLAVAFAWVWVCTWDNWFWSVWLSTFAIARAASAGFDVNRSRKPQYYSRLIPLWLLVLLGWSNAHTAAQMVAILFAEYALTIKTIPPLALPRLLGKRASA